MRRIISVLAVMAIMAAMVVASAMPVFADVPTDPNANCTGEDTSAYVADPNADGSGAGTDGYYGQNVRQAAQTPDYHLGHDRAAVASSDCYQE